jgi:hypothetical protein
MIPKALFIIALFTATAAAAQPPAVGPAAPGTALPDCAPSQSNAPCKVELGTFLITNFINTIAQQNIAIANTTIQNQHLPVSVHVSIESLKAWAPQRTQTLFEKRPNDWYVHIPYILTAKVAITGTSDRHVGLPIDIGVYCSGWQTNNGTVQVHSTAGPASFEGGNILEAALHLQDLIDQKVRAGFSPPGPVSMAIPNSKCSTIGGSDLGTAATGDDIIVWTVPRRRLVGAQLRPAIKITFDRLKRLVAHQPGDGVIYQPVENILLNAYANYAGEQKSLQMREGDDVALGLPPITLDSGTYDKLVIVGNVEQPPNNPKDSAFAAASRAQNFGAGSHVLQIPKWYSLPPDRFNRKPTLVPIPAYELQYTVQYHTIGTVSTGGGATGPTKPVIVNTGSLRKREHQ